MRPARLCRAMAAPTWFGRAPLHAAVISCWVLPVARTRTRSLRVGGVRLPPADFAVVVRRLPRGRAAAAASLAVVGILAEVVFLAWTPVVWRASTRSVASSSLSWLMSFSRCIDARERLADPLLLLRDLVQCRHFVPSRQTIG